MMSFLPVRETLFALAVTTPASTHAELTVVEVNGQQIELLLPTQFVTDTGASNRIEAGDVLRTVSQEIPSAVCHLHNGVAPETSVKLMNQGIAKFDLMLDALINGNEAIGIVGGEERRKTMVLLEELETLWQPVRAASLAVQNDPTDVAALNVVYDNASLMLDKTYYLLSELEGQYANPVELMQSDVMLLEVSGRQAMMSQRISYLACRKWSGAVDADYVEALKTSMQQFGFGMNALRNGMPEVGINPPPTEAISLLLDQAAADWDVVSRHVETISQTGAIDDAGATELYELLADKMYKMEEVAHLYAEYAKRIY